MKSEEIVARTRAEVQRRLAGQGAGHGFDHVERVLVSARRIQRETGGDPFVIELAVLLHDVGDAKFHDGVERSGQFAREILNELDVDNAVIEKVVHIVDNVSFRKRSTAAALSLEGQVVQDADRLDALGAIGIVRTIEYGASVGQPFYVAGDPTAKSGFAHFGEKLFKLRDLMNTQAGRHMSRQREEFMRTFLNQFLAECGESQESPVADA
ncbi:HD domain-containing protein [Roseiconus nitratireducens]|uniref:HD domain-containing protein n=1 Tax=Roseiconus nitratireducens TaxID=2605748 RepID=A0A5M6CWX5_9BACT|nr:HD domain-containing protein [Roseiconus nitratireducens]KAA5539466.1 HD domain-containing protein [Roseiconus nitratireducens]